MHFYGFDSYYLLLVIPALIVSLIAQARVKSTFKKYSRVFSSTGLTGAEAARRVLSHYGVDNVQIVSVEGNLTDNFNPKNNIISLSRNVYSSSSVAAIGVACHEAGHAAQYAEDYAPIKIRNSILPVCRIGSYAGIPLALLGYFLGFQPLILIGLGLYSAIALFQLATLPVEFDASKRAIEVIRDDGLLYENEIPGAKKVLTAAATTYVASLAVTMANLLRFLALFSRGRNGR